MGTVRFKHFLRDRNEFSNYGEETLLSVSEYYGVKPRAEAFEGEEYESRAESLEGYRIVNKGDLVMNYMLAWKGAYGVSDHDGIVSPAYSVFKVDQSAVDLRFLHHRTRSDDMKALFRSRSKGIIESRLRLYPDALLATEIALPDLPTQRQIADFLDSETARIDVLIEKKRRLVALLGEKESTAVCDLMSASARDVSTRKRSRLPWELELPADWQEKTLKKIAKVIDCKHTTPVYVDDGYPLISTGEVKPYSISFVSNRQVSEDDYRNMIEGGRKPAQHDIIYSRNASVGSAAMVRDLDLFCMGQDICLIRPYAIDSQFLEHQLNSKILLLQLEPLLVGSTLKRINVNQIKNFRIIVPPRELQRTISIEIDQLRERSQQTIYATLQSITRLCEYRSALITAAVTGQIDVTRHARAGATDRQLDAIQEEVGA